MNLSINIDPHIGLLNRIIKFENDDQENTDRFVILGKLVLDEYKSVTEQEEDDEDWDDACQGC